MIVAFAGVVRHAVCIPVNSKEIHTDESSDFHDFIAKYGRSYTRGSEEYEMRHQIFQQQLEHIKNQNSRPDRLWTATINHFSDRSDAERARLRGWRRSPLKAEDTAASLAQDMVMKGGPLPESIDWRHLAVAKDIPDQQSCGSCWAVATVSVLDAHHEIAFGGSPKKFSVQELVSCVENPRKCGGEGGCKGATVELGMAFALKHGLSQDAEVPYTAKTSTCHRRASLVQGKDRHSRSNGFGHHHHKHHKHHYDHRGGESFGLVGWTKLPENKEFPLVSAVAHMGPVAVSVAARNWFQYEAGIYDSCHKDAVVDHAVTLYGYGVSGGHKYWLIRNSWGEHWGDKGFIKLQRHDREEEYCGMDNDAQKGTACENDPKEVRVCGSCAILYDTVVPNFHPAKKQMLERLQVPRSTSSEDEDALSLAAVASNVSMIIGADATSRLVRRDAALSEYSSRS